MEFNLTLCLLAGPDGSPELADDDDDDTTETLVVLVSSGIVTIRRRSGLQGVVEDVILFSPDLTPCRSARLISERVVYR